MLAEGTAPAKVLICESKWWHGAKEADEALDQLLRYLESKDTSALLLFFVANRDTAAVRERARSTLITREDFLDEEVGAVEDWPVLRFSRAAMAVTVCLAFIDLPEI